MSNCRVKKLIDNLLAGLTMNYTDIQGFAPYWPRKSRLRVQPLGSWLKENNNSHIGAGKFVVCGVKHNGKAIHAFAVTHPASAAAPTVTRYGRYFLSNQMGGYIGSSSIGEPLNSIYGIVTDIKPPLAKQETLSLADILNEKAVQEKEAKLMKHQQDELERIAKLAHLNRLEQQQTAKQELDKKTEEFNKLVTAQAQSLDKKAISIADLLNPSNKSKPDGLVKFEEIEPETAGKKIDFTSGQDVFHKVASEEASKNRREIDQVLSEFLYNYFVDR